MLLGLFCVGEITTGQLLFGVYLSQANQQLMRICIQTPTQIHKFNHIHFSLCVFGFDEGL